MDPILDDQSPSQPAKARSNVKWAFYCALAGQFTVLLCSGILLDDGRGSLAAIGALLAFWAVYVVRVRRRFGHFARVIWTSSRSVFRSWFCSL